MIVILHLFDPLRLHQDAVEYAGLLFVCLELDGAGSAERLVEIDVLLFAQGVDMKLKQLAEALEAIKSLQDKNVFAQRCNKFPNVPVLRDSHFIPLIVQLWRHARRYPAAAQ